MCKNESCKKQNGANDRETACTRGLGACAQPPIQNILLNKHLRHASFCYFVFGFHYLINTKSRSRLILQDGSK